MFFGFLGAYSIAMPEVNSVGLETLWRRPFLAALLLTGDTELAEIAVLRSLGELQADRLDATSLLLGSVAAAVQMQGEWKGGDGGSGAEPSDLPYALGRILPLAELPRSCFTLRILEGLPREICASMLRMDAEAVDHHAGMAARTLAEL